MTDETIDTVIAHAKEAAITAAVRAGTIARERFDRNNRIFEKGNDGDVVTEVDLLAETEILQCLQSRFPLHQIRSEESGWSGVTGDWLWLVDPLDGTNNYALGIPVYGVSITLLYRKRPVLGVIYDSHLSKLYVAESGKGALCNDIRINVGPGGGDERKMTVGWIQGHQVQKEARAMRLKHYLDGRFKRVLRLWAPSLLWCMLARGDLDGIVLYNSEGDDLYSGLLMAKEAGAAIIDFEGYPFEGMNSEPYIIACHPDRQQSFMQIVRNGLNFAE
jgi:myo-inositol-1(or 4)-monophosphatase